MKLGEAVPKCKIRGYISRQSIPDIKYWKNHKLTILERVIEDQGTKGLWAEDWEYFNPEVEKISTFIQE